MDIWDKKKRSEVMSKIRSKNTQPELTLRKALFAKGYRFRVNDNKLPGKPDIVLSKYKTVIFVHGCFWHGHEYCKDSSTPKTNTEFWCKKIEDNRKRDEKNMIELLSLDWNVIIVWECEIQKKSNLESLLKKITTQLDKNISTRLKNISVKIYDDVNNEITIVSEDVIHYKR